MSSALDRARGALRSRDFRFLLAARLTSQLGDGLFQAYLVATLVFLAPEQQSTAAGVARASAVLILPFSLVGPLSGVFIDRWSRRGIMVGIPLLRAAALVALVAVAGGGWAVYLPSLVVVSLNRFFLATASATMPALVPRDDLLVGNSMATVGGTVVTFVGIVAGTKLAGPIGTRGLLVVNAVLFPLSSLLASRLSSPFRHEAVHGTMRAHLRRVGLDLWSGARRLVGTPAALGSITSVSVDQFLVGLVTVLSLVVFREHFGEGIASYGNIIAAGGVGVLAGTVSVPGLESRLPKPSIVALAFVLTGLFAVGLAPALVAPTILLLSFVLGLTFAWRKVPADTIVQQSVPDGYRGRVFAVYDLCYATARVLAGFAAVVLIPLLSVAWLVALVGAVYLLWAPVVPRWIGAPQRVRVRFYEGGRAEEVPRSIEIAGDAQPVQVLRSWLEEREGRRLRGYSLLAGDEVMDVVAADEPAPATWHLERTRPLSTGTNGTDA